MMGPRTPERPELGPRRRQNENWRLRGTLDQRLHEIDRRGVKPLQIFKDENERLVAGAGDRPLDHSDQLTASDLLGRKAGQALRRDRNADRGRKQWSEPRCVELDVSEKRFELSH